MLKYSFYTAFICLIALNAGCSTATAPAGNAVPANSASANRPANVPPEFQTAPITPSGNSTPGIPDPSSAVNNIPKGATPTPGIPDPAKIGKTPVPKGATPTPGIPDPKVLREQMNKPAGNVNAARQSPQVRQDADRSDNRPDR